MPSGGRRGGSGRKRTPTQLRVLRGDPGHRGVNDREPTPPRGIPDPPDWLHALELEAWGTLAAALEPMGVVTVSDGPALTALVQAWAEWREARGTLDLEGTYYDTLDAAGNRIVRKHPAVGVASDAWRRISSMLSEFGLTPSSRSRLQVVASGEPDAFESFLGRRAGGEDRA